MAPQLPCFLRGTRILTGKGELPVEDISVGDLVVSERGTLLPIKWIGRRRFKKDAASNWPKGFMPVRVSRVMLSMGGRRTRICICLPVIGLFFDEVLYPGYASDQRCVNCPGRTRWDAGD